MQIHTASAHELHCQPYDGEINNLSEHFLKLLQLVLCLLNLPDCQDSCPLEILPAGAPVTAGCLPLGEWRDSVFRCIRTHWFLPSYDLGLVQKMPLVMNSRLGLG